MRLFLLLTILLSGNLCFGEEFTYEGQWKTLNRKLDGIQTAVVRYVGDEKWEAKFYGTWQGVDYDYDIEFDGPVENVTGTATIDGARYQWKGIINSKVFEGEFTGDRYNGWFKMKRKKN